MIKGNIKQFVGAALVVSIGMLAMAASAAAEKEHHPTGEYLRFEQCPAENPEVELCSVAEAYGGEFQIGNVDVPITKPIVLQGGFGQVAERVSEVIPAANGESLVKAPQVMHGGIFALVKGGRYPGYLRNFCANFPNNSDCRVTATPELVGKPAVNLDGALEEEGTALEIPLRVRLRNPFLGGKCYIGSTSDPITLKFTTGAEPPLGIEPELVGDSGRLDFINSNIIALEGTNLVDNSYTAPVAAGCGGPQSLLVDREIDEKQALPSPTGHNRARLIANMYIGEPAAVVESEA